MHLTIEKAGAFTALKKAIRDIRLVPETIKDHTAAYNVHDTAAGNPGVPSASVVVHRNKKGKAQVTMDAEPNALGVRGLRAVGRMIGKMHPEIERFSVNRPKAAERAAFQQDFPKTHEGMTQEERLNVYDEVDAMIDNRREQAKTSMQARGISTRQQVRHNNPFAKAFALVA